MFLDGRDVSRFRHLMPGPFLPTWFRDARRGQYPDQYELDRLLVLRVEDLETIGNKDTAGR